MFTFDFNDNKYKKIHFIGIGGISMSGIAELLLDHGYTVTGSDRETKKSLNRLIDKGCEITLSQSKNNIKNPDLVVYTDAISEDNEELVEAKKLDVPVVTRGVFLGALMRNYKNSIAVSGSHGKSTATSMISKILVNSTADPSILLGGNLDDIDGNVHIGSEDFLVTEACEYKGNIRYYYPSTVIILNIDEDHLDYYKDLDDIIETFKSYLRNQDENSKTIMNLNEPNNLKIMDAVKGDLITYAQNNEKADYNAINIGYNNSKPYFDLVFPNGQRHHFQLNVYGKHNINNAMASIIATYENGIDIETIKENIKNYTGLHRRMEVIGNVKNTTIMTDYGHHPSEIKVTLDALRDSVSGKIICIWQPHTYSRTKSLIDEFSECFSSADEVVVTKIYAAREAYDPSIREIDVVDKINKKGIKARYIETFEKARDYVYENLKDNDLVITTGCGNPDLLAHMIVNDQYEYFKNEQ